MHTLLFNLSTHLQCTLQLPSQPDIDSISDDVRLMTRIAVDVIDNQMNTLEREKESLEASGLHLRLLCLVSNFTI